MTVPPFFGEDTDMILILSPSRSLSLAKTANTKGLFCSVLILSSLADGGLLLLTLLLSGPLFFMDSLGTSLLLDSREGAVNESILLFKSPTSNLILLGDNNFQ